MPTGTGRRVVVAGASGLIGSALIRALRGAGDDVRVLVRRPARAAHESTWDPGHGTLDPAIIDGAAAVVNLTGASVGRLPWTRTYMRELVSSRVGPTTVLSQAITRVAHPPAAFLSGSAVGYYGDRPGETLTEDDPAGTGFFPDLVRAWEAAARLASDSTRVVNLRTAVVVARGGGLAPVRVLTGLGLGARFGTGRQYWPWISLDDEVRAIVHLLGSRLDGPVLLAGPTPATSDEVTRAYAEALDRWRPLPVPAGVIRAVLGEAGQRILLDDMRVVPARLATDGFTWKHVTIDDAVRAALTRRP